MKKLLTIIAILFSASLYAQNNLQFNQVKLISTNDTVPVGKVWKVESFIYSDEPSDFNAYSPMPIVDKILLNTILITVRKSSTVGSGQGAAWARNSLWEQKVPMWLNAGTTIAPSTGVLYINIMEFNITQ